MAEQLGVVQSAIGVVLAEDPVSGASRVLSVGSPVYRNEIIKTMDGATVLVEFENGESLSLGRMTEVSLNDDVVPSDDPNIVDSTVDAAMLEAILNSSENNLDELNLNEIEATAAGEEASANQGGVVIERLGLEGKVTSGFETDGQGEQVDTGIENDIPLMLGDEPDVEPPPPPPPPPVVSNTAPMALLLEDGARLLSLIGSNQPGIVGTNLIGNVSNSAIELGLLDLLNYQPEKVFFVYDREDNLKELTLSIDNGVGQDLLGLSHLLGNEEFEVATALPGMDYQLSDNGQQLTIRAANGGEFSDEIANLAMAGVNIVDTSTLGKLLNSGLLIGANYTLRVEDIEGESASASTSQFLDLSLLQNNTNDGLSDLLDVPVLSVLQPVTDLLDQLLGGVDDAVIDTVLDVVDTVDIVTDPLDPIGSLLNDLLNQVGGIVSDLSGSLGETFLGDTLTGVALDNIVEDVVAGLLQVPGTELSDPNGLLQSLLGGNPDADPATQGSVDQLLNGVTNLVDGVLGTQTQNVDDGLNLVTTDLQELLTGDQDLNDLFSSLLGGLPDEGTAGSVDRLVGALNGTLDDVTGDSLNLTNLNDSLNLVTTDVEQLLNGEDNLGETLQDILGLGDAQQGGSADQLIADLTDSLDGLLGTDTNQIDVLLNETTTLVVDLLSGLTLSNDASPQLGVQLAAFNDESNESQTISDLI